MQTQCSICNSAVESETAAILTMGGFAAPRYICSECESDLDTVSRGVEIEQISSALDRISKKMTKNNVDDRAVLKTIEELISQSKERARKIESGEYDFSEDETEQEDDIGVPEELLETEEDKELDRKDAEMSKKFDKISNWVCLVILLAALGFLVYRIIQTYFL